MNYFIVTLLVISILVNIFQYRCNKYLEENLKHMGDVALKAIDEYKEKSKT